MTSLWPRRTEGLPPGQRELSTMPRFSDKPLRWAPVPGPLELVVSIDGSEASTVSGGDWDRFHEIEQVSDFHCVTTWSVRGLRWRGWRLRDVLTDVLGAELPGHGIAASADGQAAIFVTEDLLVDDVLLATHLNDQPLSRRHGAPLRLVSPSQYGYKNVKHLVALDLVSAEPASTLGPKEHLRARVMLEERHAKLPAWTLRWPYRLTVVPTALAAERGLRNSPAA